MDKEDIVCTKREEFSLRFELRTHDKTGITVFFFGEFIAAVIRRLEGHSAVGVPPSLHPEI